MIDQTFHDDETLGKAYKAIGGYTSEGDAVEIVSRLLSAGLLIRERTPDNAAPNEPAPIGTYPERASLEEQRRAFVLDHLPAAANPERAVELEKFLAGPENAVDPDPASAKAGTPLKKLSDINRDPAVTPFLPPRDYEDQAAYDRGWRNGHEAAFHIAESDAQKRGWNAALEELIAKKLSPEVLGTPVIVGGADRRSVRDILQGMKKL